MNRVTRRPHMIRTAFLALIMLVAATLYLEAQQPGDPFVAAVNEKQAEISRDTGIFGDQLLRDHATILDQAKQIADKDKEIAGLTEQLKTAQAQMIRPRGPSAPEPEKK